MKKRNLKKLKALIKVKNSYKYLDFFSGNIVNFGGHA